MSWDTIDLRGDFAGPMAGMPDGTYERMARWDGTVWRRMGDGRSSGAVRWWDRVRRAVRGERTP